MNSQVCMPSNHFALFVVIGLGVMIWALWQNHLQSQQIHMLMTNINNDVQGQSEPMSQDIDDKIEKKIKERDSQYNEKQNQLINLLMTANENQREQDYQRMANPFIPPLQRGPFSPMLAEKTLPINIPTHGEYGNFQQLGYAYKPGNPNLMFKLFGRRIYSNKYEYYVIHPYNDIKIPIKTKNDWELNKGDDILIKGFPGLFKVEIYDLDQPRYVPY